MNTPIVFIIFNRPTQTQRVFEAIRHVRPQKLFIIADGARNGKEQVICEQTRRIVERVDWPCEVIKQYSDKNLGCRKNISSGLTWVFNQADRAIILEDDCLPDQSFFRFCEEMLERYAADPHIMHISGNFFQHQNKKFNRSAESSDSYYFSVLPHIWGWATWSRAWKLYDVDLKTWSEIRKTGDLRPVLPNPAVYEYWQTVWDQYYEKKIDSWDGQWAFTCMLHRGLSVTPTKNLVKNIGFGPDALHTKNSDSFLAHVPLESMPFPLHHPLQRHQTQTPNTQADSFTWRQNFGINARVNQRIFGPIRRRFPKLYATLRNLVKK